MPPDSSRYSTGPIETLSTNSDWNCTVWGNFNSSLSNYMRRQSDWVKLAACKDLDPEVFFPPDTGPTRYDNAKRVCSQCPVSEECLQLALSVEEWDDRWGVFGGTTPGERADIRYRKSRKIL